MPAASKREAQITLNAARTKAQHANEARADAVRNNGGNDPYGRESVEFDAASLYYQRCVRELEEAINDMARFETSGDDD